jgi:DegV family protein with EDD domain
MTRIAVLTDSSADLTAEILAEHGITMVPLNVHFGEQSFEDRIDISPAEFMERLQREPALPRTSQPAPDRFEETFRHLGETHDAILAVLTSSKLSDTVKSATIAREAVAPAVRVSVIDSLNASLGLGLQAIRAAELVRRGLEIDEIARRLRAETTSYHTAFFVDTLEYLQREGRIGRAVSMMGTLIHLKPILRIDEGQVVPYERARTRARALEGLKEFVRGFPTIAKLAVLYSSNREDAEEFAAEFAEIVPANQIYIAQFGPVIATHLGPGALGVGIFEGESE